MTPKGRLSGLDLTDVTAPEPNLGLPQLVGDAPPPPTRRYAITALSSSFVLAVLRIVVGRLPFKRVKRTAEQGQGVPAFTVAAAARSSNQAANPKAPPNRPQPYRPMPLGSFRN